MNRKSLLLITIAILAASAACSLPFRIQRSEGFIATAVEGTMQALSKKISPSATAIPPLTGGLPLPTATLVSPSSEIIDPCYQALLIGETVPDGTTYNAGQSFTKRWVLRNTGSCTWKSSYRLVFSGGDHMSGIDSVLINKSVAPGGQAEFQVDLKAPNEAGTFTGYWKMKADNGVSFAKIWVQIKVNSSTVPKKRTATPIPAPVFTITDYQVTVSQDSILDECPVSITITTEITADGPGEVELEWDSADTMSCLEMKHYLTFDEAGTKSVEEVCTGLSSGPFELALIIANRTSGGYFYYGPEIYTVVCSTP